MLTYKNTPFIVAYYGPCDLGVTWSLWSWTPSLLSLSQKRSPSLPFGWGRRWWGRSRSEGDRSIWSHRRGWNPCANDPVSSSFPFQLLSSWTPTTKAVGSSVHLSWVYMRLQNYHWTCLGLWTKAVKLDWERKGVWLSQACPQSTPNVLAAACCRAHWGTEVREHSGSFYAWQLYEKGIAFTLANLGLGIGELTKVGKYQGLSSRPPIIHAISELQTSDFLKDRSWGSAGTQTH